ncbi:hypothetical protein QWZ16_19870 [Vibrio ostreicida]|uniref:Uncharacterized protein n=1 Tax=Vibrio ostreicida TaxID=526588 RepID=A0ABT8BZQ1_9VIBR|nr:hypothetical protein [Vibrio ostreicida]MDN3611856.1 hypothetical protein [Vibrio ostreicida]
MSHSISVWRSRINPHLCDQLGILVTGLTVTQIQFKSWLTGVTFGYIVTVSMSEKRWPVQVY